LATFDASAFCFALSAVYERYAGYDDSEAFPPEIRLPYTTKTLVCGAGCRKTSAGP
jgi:hypothetical protein